MPWEIFAGMACKAIVVPLFNELGKRAAKQQSGNVVTVFSKKFPTISKAVFGDQAEGANDGETSGGDVDAGLRTDAAIIEAIAAAPDPDRAALGRELTQILGVEVVNRPGNAGGS